MTPERLLLVAFAALAAGVVVCRWMSRAWLALTVVGALAALAAAVTVLLGPIDAAWQSDFALGGERVSVRLDGVSAAFVALLAVVGGAGAVYSRGYWSDRQFPASAARGRAAWSALILCMGLVLTTANGLHFLIAWELFTVVAYVLLTLDRGRHEARRAGWLYLAASHAGTVLLFAFFAALAARTGGWALGPMHERTDLTPLFWLALAGFGVKAGLFPLHIWLPSAHAGAPSHVSAVMSGMAIKMGVYGIVRFSGWLPVPDAAGWAVIGLGATSALLGISFALVQNDLKRLLAYCSVENVGIVTIGVGAAILARTHGGAAWGRLALAAAVLHVWNHGAFKSLLFFGAGSVLHATGTREMSRLGGLWRAMPVTAVLFTVGALAVSGLPPLNGFVSEWMTFLALVDAVTGGAAAAWVAMPAAIALAMAGALALASFLKATSLVFLGAPRTKAAEHAHECGAWMRAPMIGLAALCVAIGLAPSLLWPALARAVGAWNPAWAAGAAPAPLLAIGWAHGALAALAAAAGAGLWWRTKRRGLRRALTWDCGYAAPTAKMQYSSGSFAGIAAGWFAPVMRPTRFAKRPHGAFPTAAVRLDRVPETVLERVVLPAGAALVRVSTAVRRLQHGRLQSYIVYVVAGLAAIGAVVFWGGAP